MTDLDNEVLNDVFEIKNREGFVKEILKEGYCFSGKRDSGSISVNNPEKDYPLFNGIVSEPLQLGFLWRGDSDLHLFNLGIEGLEKYHNKLIEIAEKYKN
jgi:hypothetical protein